MEEIRPFVPQVETSDDVTTAPTVEDVKANISQEVESLVAWILTC